MRDRLFLVLFLVFSACCHASGAEPRESAVPRYVQLGAEKPGIVFDASEWHQADGAAWRDRSVLHHAAHNGVGLALMAKEAFPGETVEAANARFGMLLLSAPILFEVVEVTRPERLSEEAIGFAVRGKDRGTGREMLALCKIRIVSGRGSAYWVTLMVFGPEAHVSQMQLAAHRLERSLQIAE